MTAWALIVLLFSPEGLLIDSDDSYYSSREMCEAVMTLTRPQLEVAYDGVAQYWLHCLEVQSSEELLRTLKKHGW